MLQETTKKTQGKNQLGECIGKPKPGDLVKIHYVMYRVMPIQGNKKKWDQKEFKDLILDADVIDTRHVGPMVSFTVTDDKMKHAGLYTGLNEVVKTMNLGEEATVHLNYNNAFGDAGLEAFYPVKALRRDKRMDNLPDCPSSHRNRNPLCVAYVAIHPGQDVLLQLELIQVGIHHRELPPYTARDAVRAA